jgi:hypothetical protein
MDFNGKLPTTMKKFDKTEPVAPDLVFIEYIHDQKSANAISKIIDLKKYGKEYAEKVGRFY